MKSLVLAAALSFAFAGNASALTCKEDTAAKKLAGAAATSHMKKCQTEATAKCEAELGGEEARRRRQDQPHEKVRGGLGRQLAPSNTAAAS